MEKLLNSLPKPVLAILAILVGIGVVMMINPPHTVCDTQEEALRESLKGTLFPTEVKKNKIPPTLGRAKEACQVGNSAGSCFEYFSALKDIAQEVGKASSECTAQLYGVKEVSSAIGDGIEVMARLAWGVKPPEPGPEKFGWMQDAEVASFCRLKSIYARANGEEAWNGLRAKIFNKLPGEEIPVTTDPNVVAVEPKKATAVLSELDIFNRSIFSVRCEVY
ncbi:hypothetical protein [Bdellovibrio sp. NC01]|uniref:hypothetical protein n=1 Tax=Bdellovibrio sp. NC01 TaxID=2220073 RepID=UPI00115974D2|nr:hypothetical protein [Bdellovibrio sp. NC01]QDK36888.1 hypothetical protein DOE51_04420 [Bdellovibrio sp. NC01]